jgi:hypothetical protein
MTVEQLLAHFPNLEKDICYKILKDSVYYLEDVKDAITRFKFKEEYWNLCIENYNSKEILLLENDSSVMKNEDSKKCDWVLFENNKLYFVESKDVKLSSRNKERGDAIKQLIATIEFYNSTIDLSTTKLFSQICFKSKSKIIKTGDQARKKIFSQYNSDFTEGNYISFD